MLIYFCLCWVFSAAHRLSLVLVSRDCSLAVCVTDRFTWMDVCFGMYILKQ